MATGLELLGNALGGDSEKSYQEGLLSGARAEDALAAARDRVEKNRARMQLADQLVASGVPAPLAQASSTALTAGGGLGDVVGMQLKNQELGFRAKAGDPNVPLDEGNRALLGVANSPVEPLYKIGNGYANKFDTAGGITPLGNAVGGGGDAASIQLMRSFGFLDDNGQVKDINGDGMVNDLDRARAFDLVRSTERNVDLGGVPGAVSANPFTRAPGAAPTATQVAPTDTVASNAARVAHDKEMGQASGQAAAGLPDALADIDKLSESIDNLLAAPGFSGVYGNIQGQPALAGAADLVSPEIADARAALGNIDAQTFGIAIQKMRGLGQLSNTEGLRVKEAFTRATNTKLSDEEAMRAWGEVQAYLRRAKVRAVQKANMMPGGAGVAPAASAAPPAATGGWSIRPITPGG